MHPEAENEYPKPSKRANVWIDLSIVVIVFTLSVAAFWIFRSH
jgi:flagellar basal body-associated protein FliL